MARKPTPTPAKALEESLGELHPSTDAEMRLPMWLRGNMLPKHVADPVEQVFLSDELPAPLANLWALVNLAQGAGGGILTVRRDHGTIPGAIAPSLFVRNVVFMLRCARDDVLQQTAAANIPVFSARLDGLIVATKATLDAFMGDKLDRIWCDDPTCDNRGQHLLPGPWIEAWKRSADAGEDALLLSAFMLGDATSTLSVSPALPPGAEAIKRVAERALLCAPIPVARPWPSRSPRCWECRRSACW